MIFEKTTRKKLRFKSDKGYLTVEDLWDLSLIQLNKMAKFYSKEKKASAEEDFLQEKSVEDTTVKLQFDVVLHILEVKKEEKAARAGASVKKEEKERLMALLERKQHAADEDLTPDQIKAKIEALG